MNTLWAPKITLKSGKSWLYAHAIGFTRTEAKLNYLHSDRDTTDKRYGSKVTFVRVEVTELTPNVELTGAAPHGQQTKPQEIEK